ncbi:MAG TPA: ParB N-terminal domain-containing protein [Acetobacteraceae bacterium]|jgi:hypothetical protein|nr:ParB N-terminal domain-containing protein [Acetobacteraceae bacterium]
MDWLDLNALTLDVELQPRAAIDRSVLENYVQLLVDGVRFPPVVVFREDNVLWLADGFHRWHAHKVIDADTINATIHDGTRRDALLYSLSANAKHGLQRGATDYTRAYEIACRNGLVDPADSEAVAALLQCSGSWAEKLTAEVRRAAKVKRDAEIIQLKSEGKSNREVSRETGWSEGTVRNVSAQKEHSAEITQSTSPLLTDRAKDKLRELESPEAQAWSSVLRALRHINEQMPVDELYELRFVGFDHVVAVELEKSHRWISELHGRFVNERDQRRRA